MFWSSPGLLARLHVSCATCICRCARPQVRLWPFAHVHSSRPSSAWYLRVRKSSSLCWRLFPRLLPFNSKPACPFANV